MMASSAVNTHEDHDTFPDSVLMCVSSYLVRARMVNWALVAQMVSAALMIHHQRTGRREWVRRLLCSRETFGEFHHLVQEMRLFDGETHFMYFRMTKERFDYLLSLVEPHIQRMDTAFRKAIPAAERLALTLRYLAHGSSERMCATSYRIGKSTACAIILETCEAIWHSLEPIYLQAFEG
ncbi:uncharacterized protein LOC135372356 isoform X2 [Ornithodoros turicata]|uniref:uncharacterized protein LOC135372356 isoform X2 n=1 Tax=Ornithodoros turicata TaxID=34597 RepID=UPI0031396C1B